ncbi:hypothetical protein KJ708_13145 [bacterium]|nr:hypothetical protein [bacterium]
MPPLFYNYLIILNCPIGNAEVRTIVEFSVLDDSRKTIVAKAEVRWNRPEPIKKGREIEPKGIGCMILRGSEDFIAYLQRKLTSKKGKQAILTEMIKRAVKRR